MRRIALLLILLGSTVCLSHAGVILERTVLTKSQFEERGFKCTAEFTGDIVKHFAIRVVVPDDRPGELYGPISCVVYDDVVDELNAASVQSSERYHALRIVKSKDRILEVELSTREINRAVIVVGYRSDSKRYGSNGMQIVGSNILVPTKELADQKPETNQRPEGTPGNFPSSKPSQPPGAPHP